MVSMRRVVPVGVAAAAVLVGREAPESAEKPGWAGKPEVARVPVVDSGPPSFRCGDRTVEFISGDVVFQSRELPGDRFFELIKLRGARASDGKTEYTARGGASFRGSADRGLFRIAITFRASGGRVERVNSTATFQGDSMSIVNRGTCTVVDL